MPARLLLTLGLVPLVASLACSGSLKEPNVPANAATSTQQKRPAQPVAPVVAAGVRWVGRVDVTDVSSIKFAWSGAGFVGTFTGPTVSAKLRTEGGGEIYFQPVVDGKPGGAPPHRERPLIKDLT